MRGLTENELISMSTHQSDIRGFLEPEMYGFGKEFRYLGRYLNSLPLYFSCQHGVSLWDKPQSHDLNSPYPVMFVFSKRMQNAWRKISKKPCFVLTNPFITYRRRCNLQQNINSEGTIAFFSHSTKEIDIELDIAKYIDQLRKLPEHMEPVDVCFHYIDILKGYYRRFYDNGFSCFTAGHCEHPDFMERFYNILINYRYSTSNNVGSHSFYSIEMGIPFFVYGEKPSNINKADSSFPLGKNDFLYSGKQAKIAEELMQEVRDNISEETIKIVNSELGINEGISRISLMSIMYLSLVIGMIIKIKKIFINKIAKLLSRIRILIKKIIYIPRLLKLRKENNIFTHMTPEEKIGLHNLIKNIFKKRSIVAVEIGSYLGASTCFIASAISDNSCLYCIDTWGNDNMYYVSQDIDSQQRDTYNEFQINTNKYKSKIIEYRMWSNDAIVAIKEDSDKIDFLFIDGNHNYDGVKQDWDLYSKLLKPGSVVVFHDTSWAEGVKKVINEDVNGISNICLNLANMQGFIIVNV